MQNIVTRYLLIISPVHLFGAYVIILHAHRIGIGHQKYMMSQVLYIVNLMLCLMKMLFIIQPCHIVCTRTLNAKVPESIYIWLSSINKGYSPNKPNKLKVYASIKKSFSLENYVSCYNIAKRRNFTKLRISSHHLAIQLKGAGIPDQSPQENNVFAIIAHKKLLAMRCISFWSVQNLYLVKGDVSSMTLINHMA